METPETDRTPFTDILVPLDGSTVAERALTPALALATRTNVPLRVLRRAFAADTELAAEYLAGIADSYAGLTDVETEVVEADHVPDAIVAGLGPGTLVCMTSHGRGGVARAVLGSVTEELLRLIDRPVVVVGPHLRTDATLAGRIVVCIDGSPSSERTLEPAREWAAALRLPLWLVEIAEPGMAAEWTTHGDAGDAAPLARLARRVGGINGWDTYRGKDPAHELAGLAASSHEPTAILVMATHGRTGWDRLRLGSVTAATIHSATVPVLVVPATLTATAGTAPGARPRARDAE